ncbi:MAG TPA: hypothetical protein VGQ82_00530, partial [Chthoniobacterales bacterium]|nr:hypothetical protein [Chthoniobacterales bacterium]
AHSRVHDLSEPAQVSNIRATVDRKGRCRVGCEELQILCADGLSFEQQFLRLAAIARREQWSFAFEPDGTVVFAKLDTQANASHGVEAGRRLCP